MYAKSVANLAILTAVNWIFGIGAIFALIRRWQQDHSAMKSEVWIIDNMKAYDRVYTITGNERTAKRQHKCMNCYWTTARNNYTTWKQFCLKWMDTLWFQSLESGLSGCPVYLECSQAEIFCQGCRDNCYNSKADKQYIIYNINHK
jgi:hypothetical protein